MSKCPEPSLRSWGKTRHLSVRVCAGVGQRLGWGGGVRSLSPGREGQVGHIWEQQDTLQGSPTGPALVEESYRVRSKTGGLTQGHAQREGSKWVDLEDTGEIQDSSMSICFLEEKRGDGERVDIEVDIVDDYKSG